MNYHRVLYWIIVINMMLLSPVVLADWSAIVDKARGQTVYFNAWGGGERINAYIQWAADEVQQRYGVQLKHVKVSDTADVIARILAEKTAGRDDDGSVDLIWINGENFKAMKDNHLLYGPFSEDLPNYALVDVEGKPTVTVDFAEPVDGLEVPWGMAQLVFIYDSAQLDTPPRNMTELLTFARANPGRITYPNPPNFHGSTFVKQALLELIDDSSVLQQAISETTDVDKISAPLWAFLDALHPLMWQQGNTFPASAPAMRQLLDDNEISLSLTFNPNEASAAILAGQLVDSVRTYVHDTGTIGNTHFLAIPYNSSAKEGAQVVINFLLSPLAQARKADPAVWGDPSILALAKLNTEQRALFEQIEYGPATLSDAERGKPLPEPHASWMTAIEKLWQARYSR